MSRTRWRDRPGWTPLAALCLAWWSPDAAGFCGAYVGSAESALSNTSSRIAIARDGRATTLTMFNDYQGEAQQFGLIVPVPPGFDAGNLRLADPDTLALLDTYTAPRLVRYTCGDFYGGEARESFSTARETPGSQTQSSGSSGSSGCSMGSGGSNDPWFDDDDDWDSGADDDDDGGGSYPDDEEDDDPVDVEEEIELGEYTAMVVSAEDGASLQEWLDLRGFQVGDETAELFDDFISSGSHFLALEVNLEHAPEAGEWLTPLQLGYYSSTFGLPIRMGTVSSSGVQDLIVYAVVDADGGTVGVANYDESPRLEDECMVDLSDGGDLSAAHEGSFSAEYGLSLDPDEVGEDEGFAWTTEYSWDAGKCDPCPEDAVFSYQDAEDLGMVDASWGFHMTRLHLRYTPGAVDQDLVLYESGIQEQVQYRYIEYAWALESSLPMCGEDQPEDPGACYSAEWWARWAEDPDSESLAFADEAEAGSCGCSSRSTQLAALVLPVWLLVRRRRA